VKATAILGAAILNFKQLQHIYGGE